MITQIFTVCALKSEYYTKMIGDLKGKTYYKVLPIILMRWKLYMKKILQYYKKICLKKSWILQNRRKWNWKVIISCDSGIYLYTAPEKLGMDWSIEQLVDYPSSDATLIDLDGDGNKELVAFSPFHGHKLRIYKLKNGKYELEKRI